MKARSPVAWVLAVLLSLALAIPPDVLAQAGRRAGQVSRLIPAVDIQRTAQQLEAAVQMPVLWEDVVNTRRLGRARIALDDGSILNVGSESSLRVTKHDPGAQQTQLDLTYGRMRSKAVRVARPGGSYEVRTPVGVAGVVGTDFYVLYLNAIMQLIVFEGLVKLCNLRGQCVEVGAGMVATIRGDQQPDRPTLATPLQLTEAAQSTDVEEPQKEEAHHRPSAWLVVLLVVLAAAPAVAIPLATRTPRVAPAGQPGKPCIPTLNVPCT
jgi:hypothetical protein